MQIVTLRIRNFKSISDMDIRDVENALILVGKNNTGKTAVLDAVRAVGGSYRIGEEDFREDFSNIEITVVPVSDGGRLGRAAPAGAGQRISAVCLLVPGFLPKAALFSQWCPQFHLCGQPRGHGAV